jgi:hypothetical protein
MVRVSPELGWWPIIPISSLDGHQFHRTGPTRVTREGRLPAQLGHTRRDFKSPLHLETGRRGPFAPCPQSPRGRHPVRVLTSDFDLGRGGAKPALGGSASVI